MGTFRKEQAQESICEQSLFTKFRQRRDRGVRGAETAGRERCGEGGHAMSFPSELGEETPEGSSMGASLAPSLL